MSIFDHLREAIRAERPIALATVVEGSNVGAKLLVEPDAPIEGSLGDPDLDRVVARDVLGELAAGTSGVRHYGEHGEARERAVSVFVESFAAPPQLLVFGAVDFTGALVRLGKVLGYRTTVCDAREVFATPARFPFADEVVVDWPHRYLAAELEAGRIDRRTVLAVLTHDPKFDVPLLEVALRLPDDQRPAYVGAMGSRRTHDDRLERLREAGLTDKEIDRLSSPIGLDLGARTPEETAVSIAAEIIALQWGGSGGRLAAAEGRIHH